MPFSTRHGCKSYLGWVSCLQRGAAWLWWKPCVVRCFTHCEFRVTGVLFFPLNKVIHLISGEMSQITAPDRSSHEFNTNLTLPIWKDNPCWTVHAITFFHFLQILNSRNRANNLISVTLDLSFEKLLNLVLIFVALRRYCGELNLRV